MTRVVGRWLSPRFGAEATLVIAVAVLLLLLEVGREVALPVIFAAWALVAAFELASARRTRRAEQDDGAPAGEAAEGPAEAAPAGVGKPARDPAGEPEPEEAEEAAEPAPGVEPEPEAEVHPGSLPEPETAGPEAGQAPSPAAEEPGEADSDDGQGPVLAAVPAPPEEPEPELEPPAAEPEPVPAVVELRPGAPREWNLWELDRLARAGGGGDPLVDEERSYLLVYLRAFARPDGALPLGFDTLVRESFGDLLAAGR